MDERLHEIKAVFEQWCSGKGGELDKDDIDWLIEQSEKVERLEEYIDHLKHENNLLYGRLNQIRDLTNKEIK